MDITHPVKAGFVLSRRLGLGRDPFKKITGLEARVFMRQDGRVFINFTNLLLHPAPAASFLTYTLENSISQSDQVGDGMHALQLWKEEVSAWWSGHATGQFQPAAPTP